MDLLHFKYSVALRDPLARLVSQYNHEVAYNKKHGLTAPPPLPQYIAAQPTPYYVFDLSSRAGTRGPLNYTLAANKLRHMVVLLLEEPEEAFELMQCEFGWDSRIRPHENSAGSHGKRRRATVADVPTDVRTSFMAAAADDYRLLELGREINQAQLQHCRHKAAKA